MDFHFYFNGAWLEGFGSANPAQAKRFIKRRYGDCHGVLVPVASPKAVHEAAAKRSKDIAIGESHKLEVMQ